MFGMGLSLVTEDFKRIFIYPKAILTGLVNQIIIIPIVGFSLVAIFDLPPEISIGIILIAACPGGPTSNLITHLAKGDTALSVSLTALSSFITLLTIPFVVNLGFVMLLGSETSIRLNVVQSILQVFIIVIFPILLGMTIRAKKTAFAIKMEKPVRIASAVLFVVVLLGVIVSERSNIVGYIQQAGLIAVALNVITMSIGLLTSKLMKLPTAQGVSISIETGIQNGTLAITIATINLNNMTFAIGPAVYGVLMFVTGGLIIFWSLKQNTKNPG